MEQRHQFFHLVLCILLISTQVSSQWLSRRTPARIPGRGFHMSRPRIRPPPFPPGHPYYRHPQNLPPHQHPMLPVQTTLLPPNGPNSTVTTLSPNSSALNYIEITSEDPSMKTTTTTTTTVRTVNKNEESADAKATVSTSVVSSSDTSTAGVDGDDGVVPTDTSQSNVNSNDPNTVFSDRMIELLKKLGELAAEENSTSAPATDKKSDRLIEVDLDPPDEPNPTVDNPNSYNDNQNQNHNSATTESTGPEPDYSALFGSLPAATEEPQPVSVSQSLPPPPFPPPSQPHPSHPPHPPHPPHPFHNKNRRIPPKHPMRGPPPPHRPPPPKARPPPPKARHPPHPHPPHPHPPPHPPPHHPPPKPQPHNTMWNKVRGILPFSRKRVPPPHPHHVNQENEKDASSTTVKSSTSEPENPARRLDDNISEDLNAREKKTEQAKEKSGSSDPEVKISDFSLEFVKDSKLPQRRIDKLSHLPPPPPPKISSRSDEVSSSRSYLNSNSNTMNTLAKLSPKKPIMVFMRAEGIYEIHRTGQDPGKIVKKFAGSTKIQFFNGTLPKENIPPVFLAPEDSDAPLGYGKIPIPKISSKSDSVDLDALPLPKPQPTYLSIPAQLELLRKQRDRLKLLKQEEENRKLDAKDHSKYYTPKDTQSQKPEADFKFVGFDDDDDRFTGPSSKTRGHNPLAAALAGGYEIELPSGSDSDGLSSTVLKTIVGSLIKGGAPPSTIRDISSGNYELNPPKLKAHPAPAPIPVIGNPINSHYIGAQRVESHYNGQFVPPAPGPAPGPEPGPFPVPVPAPAGGRYSPLPKPHDYSSHETFPRRNSDHPHPERDDGFDNGHGSDSREEPPPPPKDGISFNMQFYVKKDKPRRPPPPPHGRGSKRPPGPHYGPPPTPKGPTEPSPQYGVPPPLKNPSPIKPFLHGHYGKPFSQEAEELGGSSGERHNHHQHHDSSIQHHSVVPPPSNFNQQNMQNYLRNNQPNSNSQNNSPNNQNQQQQHNSPNNQQQQNSFPQNQFPQNQNQNTQQNQNQNSQHNGPNHHNHHQQNNGNIFHSQQNSTQNFMVVPGYSNEYNDNAMKSPNMYVPYHNHRQQNHQQQDQHQNQDRNRHQNQHQSSPTYHPPPPLHRPNPNQIYVTESKEERPPGFRPQKSQPSQNNNNHMSFFGYESGLGPKETQYNSIEKLNGMSTPDLDLSESTPHHSYKKTSSRQRHRNPGSKESGERSSGSGSGQGSKELYIVHSSKAKRRKNQQTKSKSPTVIIAGSGGNLSHLDKIINSLNLGKDKSEEGQGQGQESEEQVPVQHFHHYAKAQSHERKTTKPPATHFTGNIVQSAVVQNLDGLFKSVSAENTNSRPQTIILQSSNQNPISGEQQTITISNLNNLNSNSQQVDPNAPVEFSFGDIAELMGQQAQGSSSAQQQDLQQQQPQSIFIHPSFTQQQKPQQQPQIIIQQLPQQPVQPQIILQTQLPGHNNQPQIFFQQDSSQQQQQQQQQQPLPQIFIHPGQNSFQQQLQQQQQQPLQLSLPQGQILHANNSAPGAPLPQVIFFPPGQQPGNLIQQQQQPHQEPQQHHVQVQQLMQQQLSQQQQQLQLPPLAFNSPVMSATPGPFIPFVTPLSHLFPGHGHGQVQGHGQGHGQIPFGGPTHHTVVPRQSPSPAVPTITMTMESFSTVKPLVSDDSLEPVLEKLRKEEKIVWKQLPGAGAEPGRMVPLRITTQEKQYLHPNGNTEVESTVVDTSIAEDLIGTNPMESIEFFKRSGSGSGSGENPTTTTLETVHEGGGQKEHHPKSVFTGLLQAKAEMEKMKQDLHFEQKSSFKNRSGQKRDSNSSSSRNSSIFGK